MADQFDGWTKLLELAGIHRTKTGLRKAINDAGLIILETEPLSGYYRGAAVKDGPLLPIAIWRDEAKVLRILRAGEPVALERVWPYAAWNPVSYEWYEAKVERGEKWPDEAAIASEPVRSAEQEKQTPAETSTTATVEPEEDEEAKLTHAREAAATKRLIEQAIESAAKSHLNIKSEDEAAAAQAARSTLNKFSTDADKKRKALMFPFESKANAIHETWMPLVKRSKEGADTVRKALNEWENVTKPAIIRAATDRAIEEAARNATQRIEVPSADGAVLTTTHNEPPAETEPPTSVVGAVVQFESAAPSTGVIKGATGRAARVTIKKVAKVTDYDALYAHVKAFPEVKGMLDRIAQRLVDAGQTPAGVEVEEVRDVA